MSKPMNAVHISLLLGAVMRLYRIYLGHTVESVYAREGTSPEVDWDELQQLLEEANNGLRIRRRRSDRQLETPEVPGKTDDTDVDIDTPF